MTDRAQLRRLLTATSDDILDALSKRQHLRPQLPLTEVLTAAAEERGFCPLASARAMSWLELDPSIAIGRLTRTQLSQLARSLYRFWRQTISDTSASGASTLEAL